MKDELAFFQTRVRDGQSPRAEIAAAPKHEIKIEDSRAPAAATAAAEGALEGFQPAEHGRRIKRAFDHRHRIGEIAAGAAMSRVDDDGAGVEQAELGVKASDSLLYDR